jgi:hypothetical protein
MKKGIKISCQCCLNSDFVAQLVQKEKCKNFEKFYLPRD